MPEARYTLLGTGLPDGALPPTLLFHRWQAYDRFEREPDIDQRTGRQKRDRNGQLVWREAFGQEDAKRPFLERVAKVAQASARQAYGAWHERFAAACAALGAEEPVRATTVWRLVVGWGTNPTFETGVTLDHLLGFPFIPGSAIKGLLHRVAEEELLEPRDGGDAIPVAAEFLPDTPPPELCSALARCRRVRALFGFLHLRRNMASDPEAPFDRLAAWRKSLPEPGKELPEWAEAAHQLTRLCSDAPAGGMVACFDAVPAKDSFAEGKGQVLTPDVLTPHTGNKPNPIPFLAVRENLTFELRYRLAAWPATEPCDQRDQEERERAADLGGVDRTTVGADLRRWLIRGLAELGLGGKTSAGYGYLLAEGSDGLPDPRLLSEPPLPVEPAEQIPESERMARQLLPDGIGEDQAVAALDKALKEGDRSRRTAVAARFRRLFPGTLERWRTRKAAVTKRRLEDIDQLLGGSEEEGR